MSASFSRTWETALLSLPDSGRSEPPTDMAGIWSRYITERTVLRVLLSGFALVLLLLGMACVIAVRGTRAIQADAETVMREELSIARLLNEVQAEENVMAAVLHEITRSGLIADQQRLLAGLLRADAAVEKAALAARNTPSGQNWKRLEELVRNFTAAARTAILRRDTSQVTLDDLLTRHDRVVQLVQRLVSSSTERAAKIDHLLAGRSRQLADESLALLGACFVLALICAILTIRMASMSIRRIEWQATELARVSWHMLQTQEETSRRFSHELHDELGQSLAAIRANISAVRQHDFDSRRTDCLQLVDSAIANVRELSQLLRPVVLDDFGLSAALRWLGDKFSQRTNIEVIFESNLEVRLKDEDETHVFRIAQEALTNIARHSGANRVNIRLFLAASQVTLTIEDNGCGIKGAEVQKHSSLGMVGMRARARQVGGELRITSPDSGGVHLEVTIPVHEGQGERV